MTCDDDDDNETHRVAHEVAVIGAAWLRDVTTQLDADASALILIQGGNVIATVNVPPGLASSELSSWASRLAHELRLLADDVDGGDTRAELERQAHEYRSSQA